MKLGVRVRISNRLTIAKIACRELGVSSSLVLPHKFMGRSSGKGDWRRGEAQDQVTD